MKRRLTTEAGAQVTGVTVDARDGVIFLAGVAPSEARKAALEAMTRAIDGCRGIESHLVVEHDVPIGLTV